MQGKYLLKFNPIFGLLGLACLGLGLFAGLYSFFIKDITVEGITLMVGFSVVIFGMGYWLFSWSQNHTVTFNDKEITVVGSDKSEKTFQWGDIKSVQLNIWMSKYILILNSGEKIDIQQYLTGVDDFIKRVRQKR